jgi:ribonuclease III
VSAALEELESILEHTFQDRGLLERALTHKSHAYESTAAAGALDNERLEFLGDSVLGFVTSDYLVRRHPSLPEGPLSKRKSHLVSADRLFETARRMDLGRFLLLGRGEEMSGGRAKKALLADAVEAIIAALYLDAGIEKAREFVERHILALPDEPESPRETQIDSKSALQEFAQARKLPHPRYSTVGTSGPEHQKSFVVEVRVGEMAGQATGSSKKSASQRAAEIVLERLRLAETTSA